MRGKLRLWVALIALAFAASTSTAAAVVGESTTVPAEVKPASWEPWPPRTPSDGHWFHLRVDGGYCGEKPPKIYRVKVVEHPKTKTRLGSAVITTLKYVPEHVESANGFCAGVGHELRAAIKLKRPVDGLILYDGSYSPPKRVWPPVGR